MTEKEKAKMSVIESKKSSTVTMGKILRKEVVKALVKKGYEVSKDDFEIKNFGCKTPYCLQFTGHLQNDEASKEEVVFDYSKYKSDWLKNDLSFRKTIKTSEDKSKDSVVGVSVSLKDFEKFIKNYCKENGKYHEPEKELEEDKER